MTIDEYQALYPTEYVMRSTLTKADKMSAVIVDGMLKFDETACCWGGPYEGDFAYFAIKDNRNLAGLCRLKTHAEHLQRTRFAPFGRFKDSAQSEEHLQKRLVEFSVKQLKEWEHRLQSWKVDCPTIEKPFSFYLSGNDDTSHTKFYATLEEAQAELELFLSMEPLNMWLHIIENEFVFTN